MTGALSAVTGWLLFSALILSLGAVAGRWVILPRVPVAEGPSRAWLEAGALGLGRRAATLLPVAMALVFVRQLVEFRDPFVPWTEDAHLLLFDIPWGSAWAMGAAASVVASVAFWAARAEAKAGWIVAAAATLALGAFPAFTGHANGTEGLRPLTLAADTLHVWAASGWVGGLALVLFLERRWRLERPEAGGSLLPVLVPAFSPWALVCVSVLLLTGVLAAWIHLSGLGALFTTSYGRLLTLKLFFVAATLALGARNWRRLTARLTEPAGADDMRSSASLELLLAHVAILVTALLVRTSPMGE